MKILSVDCNAKWGNENIFKPTFGIEIPHRRSNDNSFRIDDQPPRRSAVCDAAFYSVVTMDQVVTYINH